jgi:hypothetical protein
LARRLAAPQHELWQIWAYLLAKKKLDLSPHEHCWADVRLAFVMRGF